ncbi:MAG: ATP-grasp domain-containing protein [Bacteroidales bacterium]|jgi:predicted ATP-grasp superfamily ATP-dependent carboligase|nr:ATP-grasp domain-containing protein [Bacteroidales bacterium]MCI2136048.1 ATP-grasp domain-containing protein [Bacteroidales bacterium]
MKLTNNLVIIGTSHHNTYSMIRCFGENGVNPDIILCGNRDSYILRSRYINNHYTATDAQEALNILRDNYENAVVIACADDIASQMDRDYDNLRRHYEFFNCGRNGRLTAFMNKSKQIDIAKQTGLKVPVTLEATSTDILLQKIPYPCIIRPIESIHGGKNIQICYTEGDLTKALKAFDNKVKLLVQEFVIKDYEIVLVGLSIANEIILPAYIHKIRDTKGGTTYSLVKPTTDIPKSVLDSCVELVRRIGYNGLFGIEIMCKGDDFYFVEINLRNDATTYAVSVAGCNLPLAYWKKCQGKNINDIVSSPIRHISSIVEFNDFVFVLKREVGLKKWMREYRASDCKYFYSPNDPIPYKIKKREFITFLRKRIFRF